MCWLSELVHRRGTGAAYQLLSACPKIAAINFILKSESWGRKLHHSRRDYKRGVQASPPRRYAIVHCKSQGSSLLEEAKSLVLTATGQEYASPIKRHKCM